MTCKDCKHVYVIFTGNLYSFNYMCTVGFKGDPTGISPTKTICEKFCKKDYNAY